jgi:hypothetical protein
MCIDCVLASLRITQVDPDDESPPEVVLSQVCKHMFCRVQINISMATRTELKTLFDTAYFIVSSRK